jgi:hypothetical protein
MTTDVQHALLVLPLQALRTRFVKGQHGVVQRVEAIDGAVDVLLAKQLPSEAAADFTTSGGGSTLIEGATKSGQQKYVFSVSAALRPATTGLLHLNPRS